MINSRKRDAFSLIELLVVISILGILVSLLMSAVQNSREAARGADCKSRLRQLGIGMTLHHDAFGAFPSNGGWDGAQTIKAVDGSDVAVLTRTKPDGFEHHWGVGDPGRSPAEQTGGWAYAILPYIEQRPLYDQVNYQASVLVFHCPSRRSPGAQAPAEDEHSTPVGGGWSWAKADYAANNWVIGNRAGSRYPLDEGGDRREHPTAGPAPLNRIVDGTSNTILLGEKAMDPDRYDTGAWYWDEPFLLGGSYASARRGKLVLPDLPGIAYEDNWGSAHTAGAHFAMADGSVRAIRHSTDLDVVGALLTPRGREAVSD